MERSNFMNHITYGTALLNPTKEYSLLGENSMNIPGYTPPYVGSYGGLSESEADNAFEQIQDKKRADGVRNALEKAVAENTNGKKATADTIRLS
ncbi:MULTISPECIES: hypothetical protein [Pseudomonas]|uniref:Uncharacterized protein n=1 Tax=Pseudomonas quebecensis TaxID=2995174 RepID=A0ABY6QFZ8_9PSED|nr:MULTISPECIES: hypothetical protein [Pseudomonas]MCP1514426.1 hypothetical protein [Pseudomonas rhodesiae]MCX4063533.1 hypothetical protein [Pseudomonas quebecensis]MDF9768145.1 hypothetical protein [Pseudomonas rhodesiae]UZW17788.1 hypothetical protein OSC50_20735 [Pseudomonas quebecensis]UZW24798.1 hypothetical protein OSC48_04745 [Pseudomonas quebecensis]